MSTEKPSGHPYNSTHTMKRPLAIATSLFLLIARARR